MAETETPTETPQHETPPQPPSQRVLAAARRLVTQLGAEIYERERDMQARLQLDARIDTRTATIERLQREIASYDTAVDILKKEKL